MTMTMMVTHFIAVTEKWNKIKQKMDDKNNIKIQNNK